MQVCSAAIIQLELPGLTRLLFTSMLHSLPYLWLISLWSKLARLNVEASCFMQQIRAMAAIHKASGSWRSVAEPFFFASLFPVFQIGVFSTALCITSNIAVLKTHLKNKKDPYLSKYRLCKNNSSIYCRIQMLIVACTQATGKDSNIVHARKHRNPFSPE